MSRRHDSGRRSRPRAALPIELTVPRANAVARRGDGDDPFAQMKRDGNGVPHEEVLLGDDVVVHHYDDIPQKDIATIDGMRCTTPLRTVIDLAPEVSPSQLDRMVRDCLDRGLFTVDEAWARIAESDMVEHRGAHLVGLALPNEAMTQLAKGVVDDGG